MFNRLLTAWQENSQDVHSQRNSRTPLIPTTGSRDTGLFNGNSNRNVSQAINLWGMRDILNYGRSHTSMVSPSDVVGNTERRASSLINPGHSDAYRGSAVEVAFHISNSMSPGPIPDLEAGISSAMEAAGVNSHNGNSGQGLWTAATLGDRPARSRTESQSTSEYANQHNQLQSIESQTSSSHNRRSSETPSLHSHLTTSHSRSPRSAYLSSPNLTSHNDNSNSQYHVASSAGVVNAITPSQSESQSMNRGGSVGSGVESGLAAGDDASRGGLGSEGAGTDTTTNQTNERSASARIDLQTMARWIEQVLPFTLLLLLVFIRQHYSGMIVFFWATLLLMRTNEIIRKQVSMREARRKIILLGLITVLLGSIFCFYYIFQDLMLWRQLIFLSPFEIPSFWQAIWAVAMTDTQVRYLVMSVKAVVLLCNAPAPGVAFRRQAHLLTFIEYTALVYRAVLPTSVWFRYFLDKEAFGHFFASLVTGLYLTFKLAAVSERVCLMALALRPVAFRQDQYGSPATHDQVMETGGMCSICHETMNSPISLRCKHVFCDDCVSEWLERERTCPLCRAVVKGASLRSFGDGSTGLLLQLF